METYGTKKVQSCGTIKVLMDKTKRIAHEEVDSLDKVTKGKISKITSICYDTAVSTLALPRRTFVMRPKRCTLPWLVRSDTQHDQMAANKDVAINIHTYC